MYSNLRHRTLQAEVCLQKNIKRNPKLQIKRYHWTVHSDDNNAQVEIKVGRIFTNSFRNPIMEIIRYAHEN